MDLSLSPSLPIAAPGLWTLRSSHAVRNRKQTERERERERRGTEGGREGIIRALSGIIGAGGAGYLSLSRWGSFRLLGN